MGCQNRSGLRHKRAVTRGFRFLVLAALTLGASCSGRSKDTGVAASGGAVASGGVPSSGGTSGAGGSSASGGGSGATGGSSAAGAPAEFGGAAGSAGAPALPACGCSDDGSITVEYPEGSRVYRRVDVDTTGCNPPTCAPEAPYAAFEGAPPSRFHMRACDDDGECVVIQTGSTKDGLSEGVFRLAVGGREAIREPATVEATRLLEVQEPRVEFTFETELAGIPVHGSGRVCWAESEYICLR
jgi:hypothetical protein